MQYELTFILGETATAADAKSKVAEIATFLKQHDGAITREEHWGRRELAYVIRRNRSGFYVTVWFTAPAPTLKPLDQHLRLDESILRSLVTKAYTTAEEGSLRPVVEEKPARRSKAKADDEVETDEEPVEDEVLQSTIDDATKAETAE